MRLKNIQIGWYLATRQIKRANIWTTALIISVMVLTFLNLTVVSGVLVGLIEGSIRENKGAFTGDVIISTLDQKTFIENSPYVIDVVKNNSGIEASSVRYTVGGRVESNYKLRTNEKDEIQSSSGYMAGINPKDEDAVTQISGSIVEGSWLNDDDYDQIVIGSDMLKKYARYEVPGFEAVDAGIGSRVRVKIGETSREVTIKGIIKSKVDEVGRRVFFVDKQLRAMLGRDDYGVNEIAIKVKPGVSAIDVKNQIVASGVSDYAKVQTFEEAIPKFIDQMKDTFSLLGNLFSVIGLVVASITIFIVIFINAVTRKKFIGILKGIGIHGKAIEWSYVFQSCFYAVIGSALGVLILYGVLEPYVSAHPINFPFSDGILVVPVVETIVKIILLTVTTIIAGYVPSRMIIRRNTLDSILGR